MTILYSIINTVVTRVKRALVSTILSAYRVLKRGYVCRVLAEELFKESGESGCISGEVHSFAKLMVSMIAIMLQEVAVVVRVLSGCISCFAYNVCQRLHQL